MSIVSAEMFIARRLASRASRDGKNVMVRIASVTVGVSIAVMIISLAVINGFRSEITDKIVGFGAHVSIVSMDGNNSMETTPVLRQPELEKRVSGVRNFRDMHAYATKGGILKTDEAMQGIVLKGVEGDYDWSFFRDNMVEGELPRVGDSLRTKDILISRQLARMMRTGVGEAVEILFIVEGNPPRRDRFKISGLYDSGFEEMDKIMIPTDIRNVQRLNGWSYDQISGYEINTTDFDNLDVFISDVFKVVAHDTENSQALMVTDIKRRYLNLFDWLTAHNVNAAVIITIMLLVAFFNMVSALLIILLERTSMIGVLKALGMKNWAIQKIFIIRSSYIIFKGLLWGNVVGIAVCLLQKYTHLVKLDQAGYFLSEVPIKLGWWLVWLNAGSFVVLLALLTIPTMIVSQVKPEKTIRFQ